MKAKFLMEPFPHVLMEDYYTRDEWSACMDELRRIDHHLLPPEFSGAARHPVTNQVMKYNSGLFLTAAMPNADLIKFARNHMYSELTDQIDCVWWEGQWRFNNAQSWMISKYVDGQYYNAHPDNSQFTMLIWLHKEPKPFTGGDLVFHQFDNYTVPCNNNTGIIFYGPTRHEVPPVKGTGRYCLTCFTSCQNPALQPVKK